MDFWQQVTRNIAVAIKTSPKSKTQIAKELGMTQQCISNYLSGRSFPSLETLKKLCAVLDCTYEDILGTINT